MCNTRGLSGQVDCLLVGKGKGGGGLKRMENGQESFAFKGR